MRFILYNSAKQGLYRDLAQPPYAVLVEKDWGDFGYKTTFEAMLILDSGRHDLGSLKLYHQEQEDGHTSNRFQLDDNNIISSLQGEFCGPINRIYGKNNKADLVAQELRNRAGDFQEDYGINHFLTVLYRSLASHDEFCDGGFSVLGSTTCFL